MKCRNCRHLYKDWCAHKLDIPDPDLDRECKDYMQATHADRIRSMSDEELAEFLAEEQFRIANTVFQTVGYGLEKQVIYARRLDWLQQPAEEDT